MKRILFLIVIILLASLVSASTVSNLSVTPTVRLGEKATIEGTFDDGNTFILCKFVTFDLNGNNAIVERWSDEYTFSDATFYAEKTINEPPYYRGDDYNLVVTCGDALGWGVFTVVQPVSIAHPVQKSWEFIFTEANQDAGMILLTWLAIIITVVFAFAFLIKRFRGS